MSAYRDTFTVVRLDTGRWRVRCHGTPQIEFFGDSAAEALMHAGGLSDASAKAIDDFRAKQGAGDE